MGETFACFHTFGTSPCLKEKLNKSQRGKERGLASSLRSRLLIKSGPVAFPRGSDFKVDSTSSGLVVIESNLKGGYCFVSGREA